MTAPNTLNAVPSATLHARHEQDDAPDVQPVGREVKHAVQEHGDDDRHQIRDDAERPRRDRTSC